MSAQAWWTRGAEIIAPLDARSDPPAFLDAGGHALGCNPQVATTRRLESLLSREECGRVLGLAAREPRERGAMVDGTGGYRQCVCAWIGQGPDSRWLYDRVCGAFESTNQAFRFRLSGLVEPVMAVAYDVGDRFDWHLDTGPELAANRKLSLSLLLSDPSSYEGGDLEFAGQSGTPLRGNLGDAWVFPSFLAHRVTPIRRGRRISLVAFAYGPTFS